MISRIPPAESAPAVPRKIVASLPSIFSQIRRAVRQVAALERDLLHALEHVFGGGVRGDRERFDRLAKEARLASSHGASFYESFCRVADACASVDAADVTQE